VIAVLDGVKGEVTIVLPRFGCRTGNRPRRLCPSRRRVMMAVRDLETVHAPAQPSIWAQRTRSGPVSNFTRDG